MPLTRKGNQTKRSLKSVRKPGRLLVGVGTSARCGWVPPCAVGDSDDSLYGRSGPAEVDELAEEVRGLKKTKHKKASRR